MPLPALRLPLSRALGAAAVCLPANSAGAQFVENVADIPQGAPGNASRSENVDFADVDLDGDWDAAFADGGDGGNDQNRLWINRGGLQGGPVGLFVDETVTRFPLVNDTSRDVEFADIDADGDVDLFIANTSSLMSQPCRWWVNQGGAQAGLLGYFADETAARWVGLGAAPSSVPPALVLPVGAGGGFVDWSGDGDFADLDNDGDLDLVHSSYGPVFSGSVPTRLFLNDGAGYFSEFNPSGFQPAGTGLPDGSPGLWCEGTQASETTDSTGAFCDVATAAVDVELGDTDGDFDIDLLQGERHSVPRFFQNRLEENGGALGFRDVTGAVFPPGCTAGTGHFEQELGDLDGDGDLDLFGLNWIATFGFDDVTLENRGDGVFEDVRVLPNSDSDEEEADFLDFDGDGDLDLYVTNFTGQDRLYENVSDTGPGLIFDDVTAGNLPALVSVGKDVDTCDVDGDGDYDALLANDYNQANQLVENVSGVADTHPPRIPRVEQAADREPGPLPTVVRAHVYDNAAYYTTAYNETVVEVAVDGTLVGSFPMRWSGGQVFRGEVPGALAGVVSYRVRSTDEHGLAGYSVVRGYRAGTPIGASYCSALPNSTGAAAHVTAGGSSSIAAQDLVLMAFGLPPLHSGLFIYSPDVDEKPLGNGVLCLGDRTLGFILRLPAGTSDGGGVLSHALDYAAPPDPLGQVTPGSTWHFSCWYRDPAAGGALFNFGDGYSITFAP